MQNDCAKPTRKVMDFLWLQMKIKYSGVWKREYFDTPYSNTGALTIAAGEWSRQLTGLTNQELRKGLDALDTRTEKRFPPNAMEFRDLCVGSEYETVLDAIMCRLQAGENYEWKNQLAFNFWKMYSFDLQNGNRYDVPKLIKQNLRLIDKTSMFPLPDYSVKQIEKPKQPTKSDIINRQVKQRFLGVLHCVITLLNIPYPKSIADKLKANRGQDVVNQFLDQGYKIPDLPITDGLTKQEIKLKKDHVKFVYRGAVQQFLDGVMA